MPTTDNVAEADEFGFIPNPTPDEFGFVPDSPDVAESQARAERKADLFAAQQEARRQGEYWEGVANRAENLSRFIVEPLTRPISGALGRAIDVPISLLGGHPAASPEQPGMMERAFAEPIIDLPKAGEAETTGGKIAAGTYNAARDLIAGFSSPDMLALLPAGGNKSVLTAWISQMAGHAPERVLRANQLFKDGKTQEAVQEVAAGIGELGMAELGRRHIVRDPSVPTARDIGRPEDIDPRFAQDIALQLTDPRYAQRVILPESMRELAKEPSTPGVPSALPVRPTEEAVRSVPEQPIEGERPMPAEEGGRGVPPETVPPGDAPGALRATEAGGREVPLTTESKLLPQFQDKPVAETAPLVKDVPTEQLVEYPGGATRFMWDLGARAKTPEDVAALRRIAEESNAEAQRLMQAGDIQGAMAIAGRQPVEAYEYATGVKLDGTPKWTVFEQLEARKGRTYTPPVPDPQYVKAKAAEPTPAAEPAPTAPKGIAASVRQPGALRGGEAGVVTLAPLHPVVQHVTDFVTGVPGTLKNVSAQLAGKSAPKTSNASVDSGNALVRYASSKIAAPLVAREMATEVLGDRYKDADFGQKLGAVLVEDRLRGIKDAFTQAGDTAAANRVNTLVGQQDSPFRTEADFQAALADPEIRAAIDRHKQTVQPTAQAAHEETGGTLSGPGLNTGAFVNLKAIFEGGEQNLLAGGGRGNLMNPLRRPSRFAKKAAGTAEKYETDYRTVAERMIEGNFEEFSKRQMYDQMVEDGLAVMTNPGEPMPEIGGKPSVKFVIERKGVPAGENKVRTYVKNLWVREDLAPEFRQALNVDGPVQRAAIVTMANVLNRIQLAGPTDAVWHTANMLASIAGSQGGKNVLVDVGRRLPGVNITDAIARTVASSIRVLRDTPQIQKQVAELARIGAMRPMETSRITPVNAMHKMITLVDRAGRLVRDDLYNNLVERGLVENTEANRREWVNQMGQYNPRLMGQFQRFFKEAGFSPFIVAGRNFNRMAMRRLTGDPGIKSISPAAWAEMRAVEFLGTAATLFAIPALFNFLLTGSPNGRPGTKLGQIDTGKDDNGKHVVIDPAQWTGVRRGLRISGLQAVIEGTRRGESRGQITKDAIRDIAGGIIHPWAGPAVHAVSIGATGYSPTGYKESENPKDYGENLTTALEHLNPLVNAYLKGKKEDTGGMKQLGLSLGGAAGLKEVKPFTPFNQVGVMHRRWLEENKDPKVRDDYERSQAATFPVSNYKDLDAALFKKDEAAALKAIADLKSKGQKNKDILARMRPYVGQGVNSRVKPLFHESRRLETQFRNSLKPEERALYRKALEERAATWREFLKVWRKRGTTAPAATTQPDEFGFVPNAAQ